MNRTEIAEPVFAPARTQHPWAAVTVLLVGVFMAVLDTFIVLVAAPAIQQDLAASDAEVQLVFAAYQLAYAAALITCARLGDLVGRKTLFLAGLLVFTASSAACALAPAPVSLIVARFVQGLGAAALFPQVLATITVVVPPESRAKAFGALGAVIGLSGVAGQLIGGVLVQANLFDSSWRSIFWINVPVGVLAVAAAVAFVPRTRAAEARGVDPVGAAILATSLCLLVVPLIQGRQSGWPLVTWISMAAGIAGMAVFARFERAMVRRGSDPLVRISLFAVRPFAIGMALILLAYSGINSFFLVLSVTTQQGLGMTALGTATVYLPFGAAFFATSIVAGRLRSATDAILLAGALLGGFGYAGIIAEVAMFGDRTSGWALAAPLTVVGVGSGLLVPSLLHAVLSRVAADDAGMASGVLATGQQIGGAVGVAVIGAVYYACAESHSPVTALAWANGVNLVLALVIAMLLRKLGAIGAGE
ncbi:MFS transporter [Nocardia vermiculata]|uniref:MFS transporter n=1 Tax=Nocardia vermiculata TaxID=257274 RepID=UPI000B30AA72|nr:MFS transporter [Nocardia vermiculata]